MNSRIAYPAVLPLDRPTTYARKILIESCRCDDLHYQVRAELTDNRADYQDVEKEIAVHGLVVRLTLRLEDNLITKAEFAMPQPAFHDMCEFLPVGLDTLVGTRVRKGLADLIRERFGGVNSCWHLYSLLMAVIPALTQCQSWNGAFRMMDESMSPAQVPTAMSVMTRLAANTCHAWRDGGPIRAEFERANYRPMLERVSPRLRERWEREGAK